MGKVEMGGDIEADLKRIHYFGRFSANAGLLLRWTK